jgi:hypothetical protein
VGPRAGLDAVGKTKIVHFRESNPGSVARLSSYSCRIEKGGQMATYGSTYPHGTNWVCYLVRSDTGGGRSIKTALNRGHRLETGVSKR